MHETMDAQPYERAPASRTAVRIARHIVSRETASVPIAKGRTGAVAWRMLIKGAPIGIFGGNGKGARRAVPSVPAHRAIPAARFDAWAVARPRHDLALVSIKGPI
jgi:hypothetical protein